MRASNEQKIVYSSRVHTQHSSPTNTKSDQSECVNDKVRGDQNTVQKFAYRLMVWILTLRRTQIFNNKRYMWCVCVCDVYGPAIEISLFQ